MTIETDGDLLGLQRVGQVVALALQAMKSAVTAGVTTAELDAVGAQVLAEHGAVSAPQRHYGFPGVNCISVNDEAVHGVPDGRVLRDGDLVKLDVTAELQGYIADAAVSVPVGTVTPRVRALADTARQAFQRALPAATAGRPINEIGHAIEKCAHRAHFEVLRELHSHGVGRAIHEEPSFPQYFDPRFRQRLHEGLVITIEPILAVSARTVVDDPDGWTLHTADGSVSAHHEHTIVVTRGAPLVLTSLAAGR